MAELSKRGTNFTLCLYSPRIGFLRLRKKFGERSVNPAAKRVGVGGWIRERSEPLSPKPSWVVSLALDYTRTRPACPKPKRELARRIVLILLVLSYVKAGYTWIYWNFVKFKERLKGEKRVTEHHQTVARPHNGNPGCWATVWCVSTNF